MEHGSFSDFMKWLKYQCTQHTLLLHEDVPMKKVFFVADIEQPEFFTNSDIKPSTYCVVAFFPDLKSDDFQANIVSNTIMVFFGHESNTNKNKDAIFDAMLKSEALYLDFVERLNGDEYLLRKFFGSGAAKVSAVPRQNFYKDYSGFIGTFSISTKMSLCTDPAQNPIISTKWVDGGITPTTIFN